MRKAASLAPLSVAFLLELLEVLANAGSLTTCSRAHAGAWLNYPFLTQKERDNETGLDYFVARYYSFTQGRFASADDIVNDSHLSDPQSWNKYAYVRNNPLKYIDPTGQKADVAIKTDEDKKKGTITIKATIGIWTNDSQNISHDALNKATSEIKSSIEKAWSGQYEQNGITYTVTTEVTVQAYPTENEAINSGSQNVIEMVKGNLQVEPMGSLDADCSARTMLAHGTSIG